MEFPPSSTATPSHDTVFYTLYPDSTTTTTTTTTTTLQSLHLQILQSISPFTTDYIWQHQPFNLSISLPPNPTCQCPSSSNLPHLHGHLRYGDNLDDEWFTVFLLFHMSTHFPSLSIRLWDSDGEFLLIEAAFHLPRWVNPETSDNRIFLRNGHIHIIPRSSLPNPSLIDSLNLLSTSDSKSRVSEPVQTAIVNRIKDYPNQARKNMHNVRARVPVSVAKVLKHEPCLISLAVEGFYDRDIDAMKFAAKLEKFLEKGRGEELVCVSVKMSRAMYAQLVQQTFRAPKVYPELPSRDKREEFAEAELGLKITCGMEMIYQQRKRDGVEGKGSTWEAFMQSLEKSGYFQGLLPGSSEYQRLMQNALEYYRNTSLHSKASDLMSAPVRRIDEILALPYSVDEFKGQEVPPSDPDYWLYNGEEELNSALNERQKEMELFDLKHKIKGKGKKGQDNGSNADEFNPGDVAKLMRAFVDKVSSFEGAEAPEDRNKEVDLDADQFFKEMESVMNCSGEAANSNIEEGSSSDLDFDDSDEDEGVESAEENDDEEDSFIQAYSNAMDEQLKPTTLPKTFVGVDKIIPKKDEGTSHTAEDMDEDFSPIDVDVNLVQSLLDSFSSQQGLPGPASNLLGLLGVQFPQDAKKGK